MSNVHSLEEVVLSRFEVIEHETINFGDQDYVHMSEDWFPTIRATIRGHQGRLLYAMITPSKDFTVFMALEDQPNITQARLEGRGMRAAIKKAGLPSTGSWTNSLQQVRGSVTVRSPNAPPRIQF